jgi:glutamate N-acetyltransferase/amino-acid N-acetyltransferase
MASIKAIEGGGVTTPKGFLAGAVSAGIKSVPGKLDLCLLYSERECATGGVFTTNRVRSAPVGISEARVRRGGVRAVVVNSGCANALTGDEGVREAEEMTAIAASLIGVPAEQVAVASTGVTGVRLPMAKVRAAIPTITLSANGGGAFAEAILTTDTVSKEAAVLVQADGRSFRIGGCAKGSGMIHPNMATMLAYVTTDAAVDRDFLDKTVREIADATFNMVTVDGDTSCSDTFLVFANGADGGEEIADGTAEAEVFRRGLLQVCTDLARKLARDGEGARHLLTVEVAAAMSETEARDIAKTVALSSLVKTAVAGHDPNWGRILIAAGRSGAKVDQAKASLWMQGCALFDRGRPVPFSDGEMRQRLEAEEIVVRIDLGLGGGAATAWGCDLTTDYVHINADYTT